MVSVSKRTQRRTYQFPSGAPGRDQILYALLSVAHAHNVPKSQIAIMSSFNRRGQDGYELFDIILNELASDGIIDMNILDPSLLNICVPKLKAVTKTSGEQQQKQQQRQQHAGLSSFRQYHVMTTNKHLHDMIRQPLWGTTRKMIDVLFDDYHSSNNDRKIANSISRSSSSSSTGIGLDNNEGKNRRLPLLVQDVASRLGLNTVDEEFRSALDSLVEYKYIVVLSYEPKLTESKSGPEQEPKLIGSSTVDDEGLKFNDSETNHNNKTNMTTTMTTKSMRMKLSDDLFPFSPTFEYYVNDDISSTSPSPSSPSWLDLSNRLPLKKRRRVLLYDGSDSNDDVDENSEDSVKGGDEEDRSHSLNKQQQHQYQQQQQQQLSVLTPPHHDLATIYSS